jgi:hypothetical protein
MCVSFLKVTDVSGTISVPIIRAGMTGYPDHPYIHTHTCPEPVFYSECEPVGLVGGVRCLFFFWGGGFSLDR